MEVAAAVEEYLASLGSERGLALNTLEAYRRDLRQYRQHLADSGIDDLDAPRSLVPRLKPPDHRDQSAALDAQGQGLVPEATLAQGRQRLGELEELVVVHAAQHLQRRHGPALAYAAVRIRPSSNSRQCAARGSRNRTRNS